MDKDKLIIITLILLLITGSFGLYIYQKNRYKDVYFDYNGFTVHKGTDKSGATIYQTKIFTQNNAQPYLITTRYSPLELEEIDSSYSKRDILKKEIYITMDSKASAVSVLAATEISKITGNYFLYGIPTHGALSEPIEGKKIEVKTCADVTEDQAIILLKQGDESKIYSDNGCIILEGKDEYDLIRLSNKLIFTLIGIMEY